MAAECISERKTMFDSEIESYGRLACYDKFHESNSKKKPAAIMRRVARFLKILKI